jgi:hypothetical protein
MQPRRRENTQTVVIVNASAQNQTKVVGVVVGIFEERTHRIVDTTRIGNPDNFAVIVVGEIETGRKFMLGVVDNRIENQVRIIAPWRIRSY